MRPHMVQGYDNGMVNNFMAPNDFHPGKQESYVNEYGEEVPENTNLSPFSQKHKDAEKKQKQKKNKKDSKKTKKKKNKRAKSSEDDSAEDLNMNNMHGGFEGKRPESKNHFGQQQLFRTQEEIDHY